MPTATQGVIGQQSPDVQKLCTQFTQSYNNNRKTVAEWGRLLQAIRESNLNPVNADGKPLATKNRNGDALDVYGNTFSAICRELGVPRSTAYHYINMYTVVSTYPEWLQDAATAGNLNLAAKHIQDAFEAMRETIPANPDSFQVDGVVAKLKKVKAPTEDEEPVTREELVKSLARLIKRGLKSLAATAVVSAIDQAMKDAKVSQAEKEAITHEALDQVDRSLGINTRHA